MKKLMILGGSRYIVPVIEEAHRLGIYVITCDYLPENIAHIYSDEYCNASVIDKEEILEIAREKCIDGIISFACDPGVTTAAYVAEQMNLPFQGSYESVCVLQDKGLFRKFLADNGFNCPRAKRYTNKNEALLDAEDLAYPVIVKPTDSAGSKGVTRVDCISELDKAIDQALIFSHNNAFIIEDFLIFKGFHSSADVFTVDGEVKFVTFSDQLFDDHAENPYTPAQIIWPSTMSINDQQYLSKEIQRLMHLLHMRTGIYNIETCVGIDNKPYIMEVSPRGGGCKIAELQSLAYGVDLISAELKSAVGLLLPEINQAECNGHWCEFVVHSGTDQEGIFKELFIEPEIKSNFVQLIDVPAKKGDIVHPFTGANASLGDVFLCFKTREELDDIMHNIDRYIKIITEK